MARRRTRITSGDGRRVTAEDVREDSGDEPDGPDGEPEDSGTSLDDLTSEADPATFDRTFLSTDADLRIQGRYDPVAGPKQVLPRVAYVLNHNLVYNDDRDRWEPQKKSSLVSTGSGAVELLVEEDMAGTDTLDISAVLSTEYRIYEVYMSYVTITNDREIAFQASTDGGSTFDSSTSNYESEDDNVNTTGAEITESLDPQTSVRLTIDDPLDPSNPTEVSGRTVNSTAIDNEDAAARYTVEAAVDGLRFRAMQNGSLVDFTNGTLRVYGRRGG